MGTLPLAVTGIATGAVAAWLVLCLIRSKQREGGPWRNFQLGAVFCALFFASWAGQAIAQWYKFVDEQESHGQDVVTSDFVADFLKASLENWQSEFLQLFSFVVLSSLFIHRGSAESKDSDDRMEAKLDALLGQAGIPAEQFEAEQFEEEE